MQDRNPEQLAAQRLAAAGTDFQTLHEIVAKARQNLNQNDWDYIVGATETETTLRRNRLALDQLALPAAGAARRLPCGFACGGVRAPAAAARGAGAGRRAGKLPSRRRRVGGAGGGRIRRRPYALAPCASRGWKRSPQAAPDATRIFQLYVRGDEAWVDDHVARAVDCGCAAFFITVDTAIYSRRERDLAKRHVVAGRRRASGREFQAALDWRTVARIKSKFSIPLGLKGIATAEDARIALDHGVDWIYVSNHGGRQLDHGRGTMDVLPEVVDAVAGRAGIIVDGGFARGTDVVKALAAGANLVGLGRLQCYALAAGGEGAIVRMLELIEDEVQRCLGLLGVTEFAELDRSYLHAAPPVTAPHVFSAFPLLKIEDYRY